MNALWQDLRFGARMLLKRPGFTLLAVVTLALGIGANTAIFSVVNGVLLRPLPFPEGERLVRVWEDPGDNPRNYVNPRNFADWRDQNQSFERVAAFTTESLNLIGGAEPERVVGAYATAGFFATLRVAPQLGRAFAPNEDQAGSERVVVLSHGLWQRRFGGERGVIGQTLVLSGERATVIGVMPPDFRFPQTADLWLPLIFTARQMADDERGSHYLGTVARLKEGVTVTQARAEMEAFYGRLKEQHPAALAKWQVRVVSMFEDAVGDVRRLLLILLAAVGIVLLIACANVANLTLARAATRQREISVRAALGASRWRLSRQLLTESLLLALLGGGLGVLVGVWGVDLLLGLQPENLPRLDEIRIDGRVLAFTLGASLVAGIVFGLTPALHASQVNLAEALKEAGARASGGRQDRLRRLFVVAQLALALVLMAGAGLLIKSFIKLGRVETGFNAQQVLTMSLALPEQRYAERAQRAAFYQQTIERVQSLPGVQTAAFISDPPISGSEGLWENGFHIEGRPLPPPRQGDYVYLRWISPDYFRTMNIPLLKGRALTDADTIERPWVAVIDEAMARKHFPNEDPLGKRLTIYVRDRRPREIVGVVGNVRQTALDVDAAPHMYVPYFQTPLSYATLMVRTTTDAAHMTAAVKSAVQAVDREQPIYDVMTMEQIIARSVARRRFTMQLLAIFAGVALALAAVGIYGTLAYTVSQRTNEIGIRLALGAQAGDVMKLIIGQGMKLILIGVGLGLVGAVALTRLMASLLYDMSATDPATFGVIALVLIGVALLACYLPARRAMKVDPMVALRYE